MRLKIQFPLTCIFLLLPGCYSTESTATHTYFIQLLFDSPILTSIKETITPIINNIVKEELTLEKDFKFDFFLPKTRKPKPITVYYVDDMFDNGKSFLVSALDTMHNKLAAPKHVSIAQKVDFFGDQGDELIIKIDDEAHELLHMNQLLKEQLHQTNEKYKQTHKHNMYDIAKSERFAYVPHTGLGRIRTQSIKQHIKDASHVDAIFNRIKQRILETVQKHVEHTINENNQKLELNKICIFDLDKRTCIKEYTF